MPNTNPNELASAPVCAQPTAPVRERRVGTFSAGIVLVALGAGLLYSMFSPDPASVMLVLRFWPLILVALGAELLLTSPHLTAAAKSATSSTLFHWS